MAYLSRDELEKMGIASVGEAVFISDKASIYGAERITLGNNIRIDDFCVLSAGAGGIVIGDYVHIAVFSLLIGAGKIVLSDYSTLSSRVSVYSSSDDYSGEYMTNPTVPAEFTNVNHGDVLIGRHVVIGSGSVILPESIIHDGVAVGALSLVNNICHEFGIYAGVPAKRIKERQRKLLNVADIANLK
ncbi:acyltransferase [Shewanella sp. M16]|uniref:acyltransferase n=1 Tax=unclassified Shewanella TaxID=196818 RepID=UPI001BAEFE31|nr:MULTISPECIES: acyltransferase [unclassified Shewanella]MBS0040980.1 acyltransferase [Shewanella sp. M16]MCU8083954.1 acyltransferase [Shewanella sp. SM23]